MSKNKCCKELRKTFFFLQYREGQFEAVLPWRHAYQALMAEIRGLTKRINQQLLLEYTYETRIWSSLLNDDDEDVWVDAEAKDDSQDHLDASIDAGPFTPGQFEVRVGPFIYELLTCIS